MFLKGYDLMAIKNIRHTHFEIPLEKPAEGRFICIIAQYFIQSYTLGTFYNCLKVQYSYLLLIKTYYSSSASNY
jgi:hypothetical protein